MLVGIKYDSEPIIDMINIFQKLSKSVTVGIETWRPSNYVSKHYFLPVGSSKAH